MGVTLTLFLTHLFGIVINGALALVANEPAPTTAGVAWAIVGGLSGTVAVGAIWLALARGAMGLVSPLTALLGASIPALVGIAGGERLSPALAAGMLLALVAIAVISLPDRRPGQASRPTTQGIDALGWVLILLSGLGSAGFYLAADLSHEAGSGTVTTLLVLRVADLLILGVVLATIAIRGARRNRPLTRPTRRVLGLAALTAVTDTTGTMSYLTAATVGSLSVAVVMASFYPVATAGLARFILHERLSRQRLAGVGLAVIAAALISVGAIGG